MLEQPVRYIAYAEIQVQFFLKNYNTGLRNSTNGANLVIIGSDAYVIGKTVLHRFRNDNYF